MTIEQVFKNMIKSTPIMESLLFYNDSNIFFDLNPNEFLIIYSACKDGVVENHLSTKEDGYPKIKKDTLRLETLKGPSRFQAEKKERHLRIIC
mgnify:FL=1